jgi:hypothetical protein
MHRHSTIYVIILCGLIFVNFALFFFVFNSFPSRTELVSLARIVAVKAGLRLNHAPRGVFLYVC